MWVDNLDGKRRTNLRYAESDELALRGKRRTCVTRKATNLRYVTELKGSEIGRSRSNDNFLFSPYVFCTWALIDLTRYDVLHVAINTYLSSNTMTTPRPWS